MKNIFKFFVVFLLLTWCFTTPTRADWIDKFVTGQIKQRKIPGLSLAVIRDGKIIKAEGYGFANLELQAPATKDTVYEIGSISKQFASEAVMFLVEDGKVNLDDSIRKYLPANAPEILSANFAAKVSETFRKQLAENLKLMKSFAFLGNEKIGENHFILDAAAAEFFRYKMTLAKKEVYYHFRMNKDGKIGWIVFED